MEVYVAVSCTSGSPVDVFSTLEGARSYWESVENDKVTMWLAPGSGAYECHNSEGWIVGYVAFFDLQRDEE